MIIAASNTTKKSAPDYSLIFSTLEKNIIEGKQLDYCLKVLRQERIWKTLTTTQQMQWARLAQMAGDMDVAVAIWTHITQHDPTCIEAWRELIELLHLLDRKTELADVIAASTPYLKSTNLVLNKTTHESIEPDDAPFERLRHHESLIKRYMKLFSGREDCFARQWVNRAEQKQGYVPVPRPMEPSDVQDHLRGTKTFGIYLLRSDSTVHVGVIDVDLAPAYRSGKISADTKRQIMRERTYLISRIKELGQQMGMEALVEFSGGKGFHFWYFFDPSIPAKLAKQALEVIASPVSKDVSTFHLEVFPKQDQLSGKGFGNLVKLPLGVHRLTGKRSVFLECANRSDQAQLQFLDRVKLSCLPTMTSALEKAATSKLIHHPACQAESKNYAELHHLSTVCPPLAQIIEICKSRQNLTLREEKVILQTLGFLSNAKTLIHYLMTFTPDYNPHLTDYKISRLRGKPLGCKRIHALMNYTGEVCQFDTPSEYAHPLLHLGWKPDHLPLSEKADNLMAALQQLKTAIIQVERFMLP